MWLVCIYALLGFFIGLLHAIIFWWCTHRKHYYDIVCNMSYITLIIFFMIITCLYSMSHYLDIYFYPKTSILYMTNRCLLIGHIRVFYHFIKTQLYQRKGRYLTNYVAKYLDYMVLCSNIGLIIDIVRYLYYT